MRLAVIGTIADVGGFGLVGADGIVCTTPADVEAALVSARADADTAIVLVSPECARLAPDLIENWGRARNAPILVVLPADRETDGAGHLQRNTERS